jgi:hypothetical protein
MMAREKQRLLIMLQVSGGMVESAQNIATLRQQLNVP